MSRSVLGSFLRAMVWSVLLFRGAAAASDATHLVGPFTADDYPRAVIDRPLTLPRGMVEGEVGFSFLSQRFPFSVDNPVTLFGVTGTDERDADVAVRVGVTDRVQVEAGTAFQLDYAQRTRQFEGFAVDVRPSLTSWRRVVPVALSVLALDTERLDTAVTLSVPFLAHSSRSIPTRVGSVTFSNGPDRVVPEVDLAAPTRFRFTDWLFFRAGEDLFRVTTDEGVATFAFDLGVGVQPLPIFAATLDTQIAAISFDGSGHESSETLADRGTILLEGTLTPIRNFDVVGDLDLPDVGRGFDDWLARLAFRVRI